MGSVSDRRISVGPDPPTMIPRLNLGAVGASTFETPNLPGMRSHRYVKTARGPGGMASAGRRAVFDFKHGFATEGAAQTEREQPPLHEIALRFAQLDLLAEQVRHGITRLVNADLGFTPGTVDTGDLQLALYLYSQEREVGVEYSSIL